MITRKNKKVTPTIEAPAIEQVAPAIEQVAPASEPVNPILAIPSAGPTEPKAKKSKRYVRKDQDPRFAPESTIARNAVLVSVLPNPKRGLSAERYGRFYAAGLTVQQVIDAYVAAGLTEKLAMDDLRWDTVPHLGKIHLVLETPAAPAAPAQETPVETAPVTE
jgi:hypothetical protein